MQLRTPSSTARAETASSAGRIEAAIRAQNAEASAEPLFGMRPAGEHGADQAFGVRPDLAGPAAEPIRRPLGVAPVGAGHMVGVRAVLAAHVAALMDADALAAMEDLDHARGDPHVDLGADERVRDRIQEVMDLDVIVEIDARAPPFRELPILGGQGDEGVALDLLEQLAAADAEVAHGTLVHALHDERDGLVAFGEREEGQPAQPPENVGLRKSHAGLDFRLVPRLSRPRRQDADRVMRRHRAVGAVDLGIVERGLVDPALQIVGNQQLRRAAEKAEHAHVRAGPVRQLLRPGRLGIGEVRGAEHGDENLRLADFARRRIDDPDPLARIIDERLFPGDMVLAHHRRQPPFEPAKQIAEAAVAVTLRMALSVFLPEDHHRDAGTLQLARQGRPVRLDPPPLARRDPGAPKEPALQSLVGDVVRPAAMPTRPPPPVSDCPGSCCAPRRGACRF